MSAIENCVETALSDNDGRLHIHATHDLTRDDEADSVLEQTAERSALKNVYVQLVLPGREPMIGTVGTVADGCLDFFPKDATSTIWIVRVRAIEAIVLYEAIPE